MRSIVLPFFFCIVVWSVALAQGQRTAEVSVDAKGAVSPGHLITVKVQGAPDAAAAFFDLSPRIRGLQMLKTAPGTWEGSFAVLPSMAGQDFQVRAHLYDSARKTLPVGASGPKISVRTATAEEQQPGMIAKTSDGNVAVAFDAKIRLDTIEVRTLHNEGTVAPQLRNNYVVLPKSIKSGQVVSVTALNLQGQRVVVHGPASLAMAAAR